MVNRKINPLIIIAILVVAVLVLPKLGLFATVPYDPGMCHLAPCPAGYTWVSENCDSNTLKCTRTCEQELGTCGSYGSWSVYQSRYISDAEPIWYGTNEQTLLTSDKCWKWRTKTKINIEDWGSADSIKIAAAGTDLSTKSYCGTSGNFIEVTSNAYTQGVGDGSKTVSGSGRYYAYGGSSCSGGSPIFNPDINLYVMLEMSTADVELGTDVWTDICSFECYDNNDCDANEICTNEFKCVEEECEPETCQSLGYECGEWDDGCGGLVNCGTCTAPAICLGGFCIDTDESCEGSPNYGECKLSCGTGWTDLGKFNCGALKTCCKYTGVGNGIPTQSHTYTWSEYYSIPDIELIEDGAICLQDSDCELKTGYEVTCQKSGAIKDRIWDSTKAYCKEHTWQLHGVFGGLISGIINILVDPCAYAADVGTWYIQTFGGTEPGVCIAESTTWYGKIWENTLKMIGDMGIPAQYVMIITIMILITILGIIMRKLF